MTTTTTPINPDDLVAITTVIPARIATQYQQSNADLVARLLADATSDTFDLATWDSSTYTAPHTANHRGDEDAWSLPAITTADLKPACWAVDNWTDTGRRLAGAILTHPEGMHSRDIADLVDYTGGIPSAFRAIAGRLRAIDRAPFWFGDVESRGNERGQILSARPESEPYKVVWSIFEARYPELLNS